MIASLYSLEFPNGKKYIGISTNVEKRFKMHKFMADKKTGYAVHEAISKYGFDSIQKKVLAKGKLEYILDLEIKAISSFNTISPNGYNILVGGQAGTAGSDIAKEKIRQSKLKHWQDPKYREHISSVNSGRKMTEEQNIKNSFACKLKWQCSEYRNNQKIKHTGKKHTEEQKKKISESLKFAYSTGSCKGNADKMLGRKWINDGKDNKLILPGDIIPVGWSCGMLKRSKR